MRDRRGLCFDADRNINVKPKPIVIAAHCVLHLDGQALCFILMARASFMIYDLCFISRFIGARQAPLTRNRYLLYSTLDTNSTPATL